MFQIISDGSCDLSPEQIESAGITVVPFYVALDGTTYKKEGVELTPHDFFEYCILHPECSPKTSMPSVQDYIEAFTPYLDQGKDILCYCITKRFSGSANSAAVAKMILQEEYPDREIRVVDSTLVTGLLGLLLMELSDYARKGHSLQETWERGEEIKKNAAIYFTIEDLRYLAKGGRIGKLADLAVRGLRIRPIICFRNGELYPIGISVGRRHSFIKVAEIVSRTLREQNIDPAHYAFALGWGFDQAEAEPFFQRIRALFRGAFGKEPDFIPIQIGATIGVHTGPFPVGFGMIEKALPEI